MSPTKRDPAKQAGYVKAHQAKLDDVRVRPYKGTKDRWRAAADKSGQSLQQYIIQAVEERIARESEQ